MVDVNYTGLPALPSFDDTDLVPILKAGFATYKSTIAQWRSEFEAHIAAADPTVNDDSSAGYVVGRWWLNSITAVTFICADNSVGAAVWIQMDSDGQVLAGLGLTKSEGTLNIGQGAGITVNANDIQIDSTVATLTGAQTLTNKTLTTPVIGDFTSATHTHLDAANGGTLTFLGLTDTISSYTSGSILFTTGSTVSQDNSNLFWNNASSRLGIGIGLPSATLHVEKSTMIGNNMVYLRNPAGDDGGTVLEIEASSGNVGAALSIHNNGMGSSLVAYGSSGAISLAVQSNGSVGVGLFPSSGRFHVLQLADAYNSGIAVEGTAGATGYMYNSTANNLVIQSGANTNQLVLGSTGNVGLGALTPNASALLDMSSTTQGLLPPRMTTVQRDAIDLVAAGLIVYNVTTSQHEFYDGANWGAIGATGFWQRAAGVISPLVASDALTVNASITAKALEVSGDGSLWAVRPSTDGRMLKLTSAVDSAGEAGAGIRLYSAACSSQSGNMFLDFGDLYNPAPADTMCAIRCLDNGNRHGVAYFSNGSVRLFGTLGTTINRVSKGWFTNLEITNAPTVNGTSMGNPLKEQVAITGGVPAALSQAPVSEHVLLLFLNGQLVNEGAGNDYTRSGVTITWIGATLIDTDTMIASYRY